LRGQKLPKYAMLGLDPAELGGVARKRRLARGRKDRDAEQIRIDEEMLAGRNPWPTAVRSRASPGPPKKPSGIQNRFVLGRKTLRMKFQWSNSAA
jgi:hypothetical protein